MFKIRSFKHHTQQPGMINKLHLVPTVLALGPPTPPPPPLCSGQCCQLDGILNHLGNRPLGVSVRDFLAWVS